MMGHEVKFTNVKKKTKAMMPYMNERQAFKYMC